MNTSTSFIALAIFALLTSLILSGYQSELSTSTFIICILAKLFMPTIYPKIDDKESLAKWRKFCISTPTIILANQSVIDLIVLGRDDNDIPIRLYVSNDTLASLRPVLLWFHGGGFVVGSHTADDTTCSILVKNTGFLVVNVDYRLAPENRFPAAVMDVAAVLEWTKNNIEKHGGDPEKVYLSGESAGGNLAASLAALNYDPVYTKEVNRVDLKGLILVYPSLEAVNSYDSHFRYANTFAVSTLTQMTYFASLYMNDVDNDCKNYRACPMRTPDNILQQFPPTLIILAKHDVLLDQGLHFANKLNQLNKSVETLIYNDSVHAFFFHPPLTTEKVTLEICAKIKAMIF